MSRPEYRWPMALVLVGLLCRAAMAQKATDPLPSWNDTPTKAAIVAFVRSATDADDPGFVPAAERIAAFDNDGTMWVEHPLYTQVVFALDRVKELAPQHPEWRTKQPFAALLSGDRAAIDRFTTGDFAKIISATHAGVSLEEFRAIVARWLKTARHPRFERPYAELVYQPMLELMRYLRAGGFRTYIVTGGGQEFVRVFAERIYGVPPQQVVGSASKMRYEYRADGRPELVRRPEPLLIDDGVGKPIGINLVIGRRPVAAAGNSTGDRQMLEWTQAGIQAHQPGARLLMLVHHDDAVREYAYGPDTQVGRFSAELMDEARRRGWIVISMKNDWRRVFAWQE